MTAGFNSDDYDEDVSRKLWRKRNRWYKRLFRRLFRREGKIVLFIPTEELGLLRRASKRANVSLPELVTDLIMSNLPKDVGTICRFLTAERPADFPDSFKAIQIRGVCKHPRRKSLPCHWPPNLERQCPFFRD